MATEKNSTTEVTEEEDTFEDNVPAKSPSVPAFLSKIWLLVNDKNSDEYIRWSKEGDCFIISDRVMFAESVLPHFFKHNSMASFNRQLNQYGFRKKFNLHDALNDEQYDCAFQHPHFRRGELSQLQLIRRKTRPDKDETQLRSCEGVRIMLSDIQEMKEKQESITSKFKAMKRPSDVLNTVMEYDSILEDDGSEYQELTVSSANAAR
ncbi:heat shock factor protein-like [Diadema antillarum]|uniref:heat shock factor protein-like n=1 Tax=Diadema antillarum TaxID=105358 RepID=UPI003A8A17E9